MNDSRILFNAMRERDEAQIRLYGVLWKLVEDEVISESKARELANMNIGQWENAISKIKADSS